ncbi:hypothetical protein [Simplicispira piscis]
MSIEITAAGNSETAAHSALLQLGYSVSALNTEPKLFKATKQSVQLVAEDMLQLLGLVKLLDVRGHNWQPTDAEVDRFLLLGQPHA